MAGVRKRGEIIRQYILEHVSANPNNIALKTAQKFDITRQAVNKHLKRLVEQGSLSATGTSRNRRYYLQEKVSYLQTYELTQNLQEDIVWTKDIAEHLSSLPKNVVDIWNYGFTEIFNNAIDHSDGNEILVKLTKGPHVSEIIIGDDGEGIFRKIKRELSLIDEHHAVLELSKGKLTTDPSNHSGQGIFFSSRLFDSFVILSGNIFFSHQYEKVEDWIMERDTPEKGTYVFMELSNNTARTCKQVFDQYSAPIDEDYGFIKTVVPVRLVQYGNELLVSRSQAKRLLARVDKFKVVILDFDKIDTIGQAFADQVFRVFPNHHPEIQLHAINTNNDVKQMILRAGGRSTLKPS